MTPPPLPQNQPRVSGVTLYLCAGVVMLPSLLGMVYCGMFLSPKMEHLQRDLGKTRDGASAAYWNSLTDNIGLALSAVMAAALFLLLLLELRVNSWKRIRHWVVLGSASVFSALLIVYLLWASSMVMIIAPAAGFQAAQKKLAQPPATSEQR
jgi:hypothetical protein